MAESYQQKLKRVRPDRPIIAYEVHTGGAMEKRELPFVVGVMGDFSGDPTGSIPRLKERRFVTIDRDNFNEVLASMKTGLKFTVENTLEGDDTEIPVELKFSSMDDFSPARVAEQIEPLKKLMETRNQLKQLESELDRNDKLEEALDETLRKVESGKEGE